MSDSCLPIQNIHALVAAHPVEFLRVLVKACPDLVKHCALNLGLVLSPENTAQFCKARVLFEYFPGDACNKAEPRVSGLTVSKGWCGTMERMTLFGMPSECRQNESKFNIWLTGACLINHIFLIQAKECPE